MNIWLILILAITLQAESKKPKQDSLLDVKKQISEDLRKQKLEEKNPLPTPPSDRQSEPENEVKMECITPDKCTPMVKKKKVVRPDGLEVR